MVNTKQNKFQNYILSLQHTLAMFGSTVLVPFLTGLDVSMAILCAGLGTLVFHLFCKGRVPVFLGSSFAFISAIALTLKTYGIAYVKGGIIVAGLVYILIAALIYFLGKDRVIKLFPAIVTGPIIMAIGLRLSPVALHMSGFTASGLHLSNFILALVAIVTIVSIMFISKSFFRYTPIITAVILGYIVAVLMGATSLQHVYEAPWVGFSSHFYSDLLVLPKFSFASILAIAPIALVTTIEHIGDVKTNGEVVGQDFLKNPGLHRTLSGDGFATMLSGFLGGPAVTTYGENTGVLAITKMYSPSLLRMAAVFAIIISCIGKLSALITNIPQGVMGGVSLVLFGMIASIGVRGLMGANLDFSKSRNLIIPAMILTTGIGLSSLKIGSLDISGLFIATIVGVGLNIILPKDV